MTCIASWILMTALVLGQTGHDELVRGFADKLTAIQNTRKAYRALLRQAQTETDRGAVYQHARAFVVGRIVRDIFPAWMGTPWHMGEDDDARMPHEEGKRVSCSMFVTAVLQNAGLVLDDRRRWAESPALHIQRSLAPRRQDLYRILSIPAEELAEELANLPDGLYVIGLNCHVGFILVGGGDARFVHSDYTDPDRGVTIEPVATSRAIQNSRDTGYWITPLFHDERLVRHWIEEKPVPLQKLGM